ELVGAQPAHRLGRHSHHEPTGRHDLARRHQRAGADLSTFLDEGAVEDHGPDANAGVVLHRAGVNDGAVADLHTGAHDARMLRRDVEHRAVLYVRVAPEPHVIIIVAAMHGHLSHACIRPDAHNPAHLGRPAYLRPT